MFLIRLVFFPLRLAFGSARFGWRTGRLVGPNRALFFGLGVATGVLVASPAARRRALTGAAAAVAAVRDRASGGADPAPAPIAGVARTPTVTVPDPVPSVVDPEPGPAPTDPDGPTGMVSPSD